MRAPWEIEEQIEANRSGTMDQDMWSDYEKGFEHGYLAALKWIKSGMKV